MARKPALRQNSFAGGVISPRLFGRTDLATYPHSVQSMDNFIVEPTGVASNRPGFQFIRGTKDSTTKSILAPFVFSEDQAYAVEFGHKYIRFQTLGGTVLRNPTDEEGLHNGGTSATVLTDTTKAWTVDEWVGSVVRNRTDGSRGRVVSNTATTMTVGGLAGGLDNEWKNGDEYDISLGSGIHTGSSDVATLTDSGKTWTVDEWVGATVKNLTDGSEGRVTSNTATTVTAVLAGGAENLWDTSDEYIIDVEYEITSPYDEEDLAELDFAQNNDIIFITHRKYAMQKLQRFAENDWRLSGVTVTRPVKPPINLVLNPVDPWAIPDPTHPDTRWDWVVTSIDSNGAESLPSAVLTESNANLYPDRTKPTLEWDVPLVGNTPNRYAVYRGRFGFYGFVGETTSATFIDDANIPDFSDAPPQETDPFTHIKVASEAGDAREALFTGTQESRVAIKTQLAQAFDDIYTYHFSFKVTCTGFAGLPSPLFVVFELQSRPTGGGGWTTHETETYSVVQDPVNTVFSKSVEVFIATANQDHEFRIVQNQAASFQACTLFDEEKVTWVEATAEATEDSHPGSVCMFDQRLFIAGFGPEPTTIKASRPGSLTNFDISEPLKDSDAISFALASLRNDEIRDLIPQGAIIAFTAGSEWIVRGGEGAPLSPISFDLKPKTSYGSNIRVRAIPVGDAVLFVTDGQKKLRELLVDPFGSQTRSRDLSVTAEHLLRKHTAIGMQFADVPYQIVWIPRSDGKLLGMTYVREHEVYGWHTHATGPLYADGTPRDMIESVCVIPEDNESRMYAVIKRLINGATVRNVERMATRSEQDSEDKVFLDSSLSLDGRNKKVGAVDPLDATDVVVGEILNARLEPVRGTHNGSSGAAVLSDSTGTWVTDEWVGFTLKNVTDGSTTVITANTNTTITGVLAGGDENDWDASDKYEIVPDWLAGKKLTLRIVGKVAQATHTTGADAASLNDANASFTVDEWNSGLLTNLTDRRSTGAPTANTAQVVTAAMAGGLENDWDVGDAYELESAPTHKVFVSGDVGTTQVELRIVVLGTVLDSNGELAKDTFKVRLNVTRFIDQRTVEVTPATTVPTQLREVYGTDWGIAQSTFGGLGHLEGEEISVLVDGATHASVTVSSGSITLDSGVFAERIIAGLAYRSELITLPIDIPGDDGSARTMKKTISSIYVEVDEFRGMWVGHKRSAMVEAQQRLVSRDYETISPENRLVVIRPRSGTGRLVNAIVQQRDPLPLTVQSIIAAVEAGGNQ